MRQPHHNGHDSWWKDKNDDHTSDMLTNFKMIFFCICENDDDLASKCKNKHGAAAETSKVMKDYVQKG